MKTIIDILIVILGGTVICVLILLRAIKEKNRNHCGNDKNDCCAMFSDKLFWFYNKCLKNLRIKKYVVYYSYISDLFHSLFKKIKEPCIDRITQGIPKGGIVFDIGANYGQFAAYASKLVGKRGRVYCFEPHPYPAMVLRHMVFLKRLQQVVFTRAAVSDRAGKAFISTPIENGWKPKHALSYITLDANDNAVFEQTSLTTLDRFIDANNICRVDFIKCDTEGSEYEVLKGALHTLKTYKPPIYCEIEKPYCDRRGVDVQSIFKLLENIGYTGHLLSKDCALMPVNAYVRKANYFFIPHESVDLKKKNKNRFG